MFYSMEMSPTTLRLGCQLAEKLAGALISRGLHADVMRGIWVLAGNPAGAPPADDPRARTLSPGLQQVVKCAPDAEGRLTWYWQWPGPTRESPADYERLGPAEEIAEAADKIAQVLHVADGQGDR
jgi:hypothetical protein